MEYYKKGQGLYARVLTLIGALLVGALAAQQLYARLPQTAWWAYLASGLVFAAFAAPSFYFCLFHGKVGDYLIETQTELRKVSWSPWNEVVGATMVVIVTVAVMTVVLFGVDQLLVLVLRLTRVY